jgi:hypothetical protein
MGSWRFTGTVQVGAGDITNEHIAGTAGIDADKLEHLHKVGTNFALAIGGTPAAREELVYVCKAATASIRGFHALLNVDGSSTSVTVDLKKNGVSILSAPITITNSTGDGVVQDGSISNAALVAGDRLSMQLAVSSATGAQGPFAWAEIDERAG